MTPETPSSVLMANRSVTTDISLAELGLRGSFRLLQTMRAVSPKLVKCLIARRLPTPRELREIFEKLGTTYIKFGQLIASSPSLFPPEYVEEFQACLDRTPPLPFSRIRDIIENDLERPLHEVFEWVDNRALASASIAQVHAAKLLTGEDVVIKVQKPGVQALLTVDMNSAYFMSRIVELLTPNMDKDAVAGIIAEMYQAMLDECDFIKEANNLETFAQFLKGAGNTDVVVPRTYRKASSRRVLTMERFYGKSLTDPEAVQADSVASEALFNALNTWFASLMECEFFHADLHSGNMLLLNDGRVGFIDFGMVGRIDPEVWAATFSLFSALNHHDYPAIAKAMLDIGITRDEVDVDQLTKDIEKLFDNLFEVDPVEMLAAGEDLDGVSSTINQLGAIAKDYGIRFPRAFTLLLKQFLYFDRYVDMLAPGTDIFRDERIDMLLD